MKYFLICLLVFKFLSISQAQNLYPIQEDGLIGLINKLGTVKIKTKFHDIGIFSEGLAPARDSGYYGFIDTLGTFAIPPIYDYATKFSNGFAMVFKGSKPYFINTKNEIAFEHDYYKLSPLNDFGYCTAKDKKGGVYILNKSGQKITPQRFNSVEVLENGYFLVKYNTPLAKKHLHAVALMNMHGAFVIEPTIYDQIKVVGEGLLIGSINYNSYTILNSYGAVKFKLKKEWDDFNIKLSNGIFIFYSSHKDFYKKHKIVVDTNGLVLINNPKFKDITSFQHGVAITKDNNNYYLIDKSGKILTSKIKFTPVQYNLDYIKFEKGIIFVQIENNYRALDTLGKLIGEVAPLKYKTVGSFNGVLYSKKVDPADNYSNTKTDYWDPFLNKYYKDKEAFKKTAPKTPKTGLKLVQSDGFIGYITPKGKYVWKRYFSQELPQRSNITSMTEGFFYAASDFDTASKSYGGWGGSSNHSKKILFDKQIALPGLSLEIRKHKKDSTLNQAITALVYLVNMDSSRSYFTAQDSRLDAVLQALHPNGQWKDIEYLRGSWCGNSYHVLYLDNREYWTFNIPLYDGAIKTKMRVKVSYFTDLKSRKKKYLYSNTVDVGINPSQFWKKMDYRASNIMDPYD